ncbi:DUF92 domain-containing protein [Melioribacteraceae bacterium 4301-Me]|uniref:DUF92 domain-containing protein n=1 Tax=Pyranulibacter aquaticus TaxID=3163344 RepID=UPI003598907B
MPTKTSYLLLQFLLAVLFSFIITLFAYKRNLLTKAGSILAFILGTMAFGLGSFKWSIPLLTFFFSSSGLTVLNDKLNRQTTENFKASKCRNYFQVLANGAIPFALLLIEIFFSSEIIYYVYLVSIATANSDTWSTEIGTMLTTKTYNVTNFKLVKPGTSGGISVIGTFGGILGAILIPFSDFSWYNKNILSLFVLIILSALAGNFIDSILGATLQSKFYCNVCGKETEKRIHCNNYTEHISGIKWLDNNFINFLSALVSCIIFLTSYKIFFE